MKNIGPLFAAVILALLELTSILRTHTQLELWEWSFILVLFIAFFAGAIGVAKIAELVTDRILEITWRRRLDSTAFATGTAIAFWMTVFSWLPFFGLSMLKNGGISAGLSPLFIGVTIASAGIALASITYQWKRQNPQTKFSGLLCSSGTRFWCPTGRSPQQRRPQSLTFIWPSHWR